MTFFFLLFISRLSLSQDPFSLEMQNGHSLPITCVAIHPDAPIVVTGSQDYSIIFWNANTKKQLKSVNVSTASVIGLQFNRSGDLLLALTSKNEVILINPSASETLVQRKFELKDGYILSASFTTNPDIVAVGSNRNDLFLWNYKTNEISTNTRGFDTRIDNRVLHVNGDQKIEFENAQYFKLINFPDQDTLTLEFDKSNNYQFHPNSNLLAMGSAKLIAGVFNTSSGELIQKIEPNTEKQCDGCNLKVFWNPDGKQLATYDHKNGLYVWDNKFQKPVFKIELAERIEYYFFSNTGRYIILSNDKSLWVIDVLSKKIIQNFSSPYLNNFKPVLDPEEAHFYIPGDLFSLQKINLKSGKKAAVYSGINNQKANQLPYDYLDWYQSGSLKHFKQLSPVELSHHKDFLILGKVGLEVQKLDLQTGKINTLFQSEKSVTVVKIADNDSLIVAGDAGGNIVTYDLPNKMSKVYPHVHADMILDFAFVSNESIISCGWDGRTYHLDLKTGKKTSITEQSYATNKIIVDSKKLYYFRTNLDNSVVMHEMDSHQEVKRFIGHTDKIMDLSYDEASGRLFTCSLDGSVRIWNIASGLLIKKFYLDDHAPALCIAKHPSKEQLLVGGIDRNIYFLDLQEKERLTKVRLHTSGIASIQIYNPETAIIRGLDGTLKFIDLKNKSDLLSLYLYPDNEWLAVAPESMRFDGTKKAMTQIHLVKGVQTQDIGNLFKQYFSPDLMKTVLTGDIKNTDQGRHIEDILDNGIRFNVAIQNNLSELITPVKDSVYLIHDSRVTMQLQFEKNYKYQDILVYNNGKLILTESNDEEVTFRGSKNGIMIEVPLSPQRNSIDVKVIDTKGIEYTFEPIHLNYDTVVSKTDLYILSLGINEYQNKNYNLKYAKNDASEFVISLSEAAKPIYEQVFTYALDDKKVTKENVTSMIHEISATIGPEDVFVLYYAGHGVMIEDEIADNEFFLVMSDITNLYGGIELLREKGISSKELLMISKNIPAQKQVFFLDACQAGAALDVFATRGVSREKTIAQLARSSGTFFITASQDIEYANEASNLKHGLFTFAILELLTGKAPVYADNILSVGELKNYVEQRVPELSEQFKTSPQYPTGYNFGNDFPIGVLDPEK